MFLRLTVTLMLSDPSGKVDLQVHKTNALFRQTAMAESQQTGASNKTGWESTKSRVKWFSKLVERRRQSNKGEGLQVRVTGGV